MSNPKFLHGWYSQTQVDCLGGDLCKYGYAIYEDVKGQPVKVTFVTETFKRPDCNWSDLVYIGAITNKCLQTDPWIDDAEYYRDDPEAYREFKFQERLEKAERDWQECLDSYDEVVEEGDY